MSRLLGTLTALLALMFAASTAAQDTVAEPDPFAPLKVSPSSLITIDHWNENPVSFDYTVVNETQETRRDRLDFATVYDVSFQQFVDDMMKAMHDRKPPAKLSSDALKYTATDELIIIGRSVGTSQARFTLSHPKSPFRFTIDVKPDGGRAKVYVRNEMIATRFGGIVPSRVGFKPIGAEMVPLRHR